MSLEKQLQDKQCIVERLLDGPRHQSTNITATPYTIPNGFESRASSAAIMETAMPAMVNSSEQGIRDMHIYVTHSESSKLNP